MFLMAGHGGGTVVEHTSDYIRLVVRRIHEAGESRMHECGITEHRNHFLCARLVGECLGKSDGAADWTHPMQMQVSMLVSGGSTLNV